MKPLSMVVMDSLGMLKVPIVSLVILFYNVSSKHLLTYLFQVQEGRLLLDSESTSENVNCSLGRLLKCFNGNLRVHGTKLCFQVVRCGGVLSIISDRWEKCARW